MTKAADLITSPAYILHVGVGLGQGLGPPGQRDVAAGLHLPPDHQAGLVLPVSAWPVRVIGDKLSPTSFVID